MTPAEWDNFMTANYARPEPSDKWIAIPRTLLRELETIREEARNLCALIHGDNGAHREAIGDIQSIRDAIQVWGDECSLGMTAMWEALLALEDAADLLGGAWADSMAYKPIKKLRAALDMQDPSE